MSSVIVSVVPNDLTICCAVISTRSSPSGAAILLLDPAALQKLQNSLVYLNISLRRQRNKRKQRKTPKFMNIRKNTQPAASTTPSPPLLSSLYLHISSLPSSLARKKQSHYRIVLEGGGKPSLHLVQTALLGHSLSVAKLHQIARE